MYYLTIDLNPFLSGGGLRRKLLLLCLFLLSLGQPVRAGDDDVPEALRPDLERWVKQGGVAVGLNGHTQWAYHAGSFIPASILKLATSQAALHHLGPDYHFRTMFYVDQGTLYVQGRGDPFLISEEWELMGQELAKAGVFAQPLQELVVDDSAFAPDQDVDGRSESLNPYDARLGALVSNFNTVFVEKDRQGRVTSAESQTPLTPLAVERARRMPRGRDRISFSNVAADGPRYSGELAMAIFARHGAVFTKATRTGRVPSALKPVWVHTSSRALKEVVRAMLEFSNNFVANQLVLAMALEQKGPPARLQDGLDILNQYLIQQLGLAPQQFHLVEGAGLSRQNRIDLEAMLIIVDHFYPWQNLLALHKTPGLALPAKTGTLTGVYSLAGFLPAPAGQRRPFVIMLNQSQNRRDDVMRLLAREIPQAKPLGRALPSPNPSQQGAMLPAP